MNEADTAPGGKPRTCMIVNFTTTAGRVGSIPTTPETWQADVARARGLGWDVVLREVSMVGAPLTVDLVRIRGDAA